MYGRLKSMHKMVKVRPGGRPFLNGMSLLAVRTIQTSIPVATEFRKSQINLFSMPVSPLFVPGK